MTNSFNNSEIPNAMHKLLLKQIAGVISSAEKVELDLWLESGENRQIAEAYIKAGKKVEGLRDMYSVDEDRAWECVQNFGRQSRQKTTLRRRIGVAMLSAAVITIGIIVVSIVNRPEEATVIALERNIDVPKIILADGREVSLDSLTFIDGVSVDSDAGEIEYKTSSSVESYNTIVIPTGLTYKLVIADGTTIWLNSQTELKYPVNMVGAEREVWLKGEAYFEVTKNDKPFTVHIADKKVHVLGTKFNVNDYDSDASIKVTLVSGSVGFDTRSECRTLTPGQQIVCERGSNNFIIKEVDTRLFTSWIHGDMVFHDMKLSELVLIVERWYGLKITFKDVELGDYIFSGTLTQNASPEKLVEIIAKTANLKWGVTDISTVVMTK